MKTRILRSKADLLASLDESIAECKAAYQEGQTSKEDRGMLLVALKGQISTLQERSTKLWKAKGR